MTRPLKPKCHIGDIQIFRVTFLTHRINKDGVDDTGTKTEFILANTVSEALELAENVGLIDEENTLEIESIEILARRVIVPNHIKCI